jgi:hypothetical protein
MLSKTEINNSLLELQFLVRLPKQIFAYIKTRVAGENRPHGIAYHVPFT